MIFRWIPAAALAAVSLSAGSIASPVTFHKDVAPVLQKNCQGCHRPGETGPMSLLTYKEARPWAAAIREAVLTKKMPPWFADPHYGQFSNGHPMSQAEIDTLVAWANTGALEGNPKDAPAPGSLHRWLGHRQAGRGFRNAYGVRVSSHGDH